MKVIHTNSWINVFKCLIIHVIKYQTYFSGNKRTENSTNLSLYNAQLSSKLLLFVCALTQLHTALYCVGIVMDCIAFKGFLNIVTTSKQMFEKPLSDGWQITGKTWMTEQREKCTCFHTGHKQPLNGLMRVETKWMGEWEEFKRVGGLCWFFLQIIPHLFF